MYYRSQEGRRPPSPLPLHYSGSAFRSDGTPVEIPVRRESEIPLRENIAAEKKEEPTVKDNDSAFTPLDIPVEKDTDRDAVLVEPTSKANSSFLTRLLGGILPGIRQDDLLLLLLLLLLSREEGNEEMILLLAVLLFGG